MCLCLSQVELATKRPPMKERTSKRKADDQPASEDGAAEEDEQPVAPAKTKQQPAAPKPAAPVKVTDSGPRADGEAAAAARPAKRARQESNADQKHKLLRAVALGGLTPEVLEQALAKARAAGQVSTGNCP